MNEPVSIFHVIRGAIILLMFLAGGGWLLYRAMKRSEDPALLLFKWIITGSVVAGMLYASRGGLTPFDVFIGVIGGLFLVLIWGTSIGAMFAKPFTMLYDDGQEIEPQPFYSIAEAKRKRGHYTEAIAEIRKQLDKFPTDFQGQMMLAEIQAENLNDLQSAELTVQRICQQTGHPNRHIALALNTFADWHLKYTQDREAAQRALEEIVARFPGSELALLASQRIAHLASTEKLLESHDRRIVLVPEGIKNIGLLQSPVDLAPTEGDAATRATKFVEHLQQHPFDTEAREKLAVIYADEYKRLDLAQDQLDQLIELPNQPAKSVVHWLNLLADLQVKHGAGYEATKETLQRVIDRFPNNAAADVARNRMDLIKLEIKGIEKKQPVKMGTYEQNIGLKYGPPRLE